MRTRGTPDKKAQLARTLIARAAETRDDPTSRYVLLRVARDLAVLSGNVRIAREAIRAIRRDYQAAGLEMKLDAIAKIAPIADADEQEAVAIAGLELMQRVRLPPTC